MTQTLKCFYLDEPLSNAEERDVIKWLASRNVVTSIDGVVIEHCRVPNVFSLTPPKFKNGTELLENVDGLRKYLKNAGLKNSDSRAIWVMPRDPGKGVRFQMAFYEETGKYPFVIQPWEQNGKGEIVRGEIAMVDMRGVE